MAITLEYWPQYSTVRTAQYTSTVAGSWPVASTLEYWPPYSKVQYSTVH